MNLKNSIALIAISLFLAIGLNGREENPGDKFEKKFDIEKAFNLSQAHEGIRYAGQYNCAAFDRNKNMFYTDFENSRLIKINKYGKFAGFMGGQGKKPENLFHPMGVFCRGDIIYVLDHYGQKVKQFSLDGKLLDQFNLDGVELTTSLYVDENFIYLNALYKDSSTFTKRKVVTVVTKKGKKFAEIGNLIVTNDYFSYLTFNQAGVTVLDNRLYFAFQLVPIIAAYDLEGNELIKCNLTRKNLEAIAAAQDNAEQKGHDTPIPLRVPELRQQPTATVFPLIRRKTSTMLLRLVTYTGSTANSN